MVVYLLFLALGLAAHVFGGDEGLARRRIPEVPSKDPFYLQPHDIGRFHAGQIIRSRKTPGALGTLNPAVPLDANSSYQLLYRTTDSVGAAVAALCTIIIPHDPDFTKVMAYQTAYDSANPDCSPSYTLQQKSNETAYDPLFISAALNQGWIVTTSDYEGLKAAYVSGIGAGYATLDSVRATLASTAITKVSHKAKYALWGYSGGALAAEWALELQPAYAPELKFIGAALGGLTPNATSVIETINGGLFSALVFSGLNGLAAAYSNMSSFLSHHLIPSKAADFYSVKTSCPPAGLNPNVTFANVFDYFDTGDRTLYRPIVHSVLAAAETMGFRAVPAIPIYAYKAVEDEVSVISDTDKLLAKYCAEGARITYERNLVGEHVTEAVLGAGGAFAWLKDRYNGMAVPQGCTTRNVLVSSLKPATLNAFGDIIGGALDMLLNQPLGPGSIYGIH